MKKKTTAAEIKLDLACGKNKTTEEGFIGVDNRSLPGVDKVYDLKKMPWPWKDNSVDAIKCYHYLPYLTSEERMKFMDECYRILKPEAKMEIKVPHWSNMRSVQDPYYVWPPVCEVSFLMYNKEWRKNNDCEHYPIKTNFDFGYGHALPEIVGARNDEYKQFAVTHYNNVIVDLVITFIKR